MMDNETIPLFAMFDARIFAPFSDTPQCCWKIWDRSGDDAFYFSTRDKMA